MAKIIKKYYALAVEGEEANIHIFGDIVSWEWFDSDVSSYTLAKEIEALSEDVKTINVFINSYGGEVAEGLAIYNQLRRHKATVKTYCDGFACSAASVVFMAGEERIMSDASLLMIHNAWMWTAGNSNELRKDADDLETITQASVNAYMAHVNIDEEEVKKMMDEETWILADDAVKMGFATSVEESTASNKVAASVRQKVAKMMLAQQKDKAIGRLAVAVTLDATQALATLEEMKEKLGEIRMAMDNIPLSVMSEPVAKEEPEPEPKQEPEPEDKAEKLTNLLSALLYPRKENK